MQSGGESRCGSARSGTSPGRSAGLQLKEGAERVEPVVSRNRVVLLVSSAVGITGPCQLLSYYGVFSFSDRASNVVTSLRKFSNDTQVL